MPFFAFGCFLCCVSSCTWNPSNLYTGCICGNDYFVDWLCGGGVKVIRVWARVQNFSAERNREIMGEVLTRFHASVNIFFGKTFLIRLGCSNCNGYLLMRQCIFLEEKHFLRIFVCYCWHYSEPEALQRMEKIKIIKGIFIIHISLSSSCVCCFQLHESSSK